MLMPHYALRLSVAEQHALEALQRAGKTPQQTVRRGGILLLAPAGLSNQAIADQVGTSRNLVKKWRKRFARYEPPPVITEEAIEPVARLAALQDLPRAGRPPGFSPAGPAHGHRRRGSRRGSTGVWGLFALQRARLGAASRRTGRKSDHESGDGPTDCGRGGARTASRARL